MKKQTRMANYTHFTIRLCRDLNAAEHDDVITIKPRWNEFVEDSTMMEYSVHHRIASCSAAGDDEDHVEQYLFSSSMYTYVGNLIDLLTVDIQPFKQIQFDFPCMPTVVVSPSQLPNIRHVIMGAVYGIQLDWPIRIVKKAKKSLNANAEPFIPAEAYRTPQRPATRSSAPAPAPPRVERPVARHIFFDEEDGRVTRYFN